MNLIINIQENKGIKDSTGQVVPNWVDVSGLTNLYASAKTTGGGEFYAAQKVHAETNMLFKIRYINGITTKMRVSYNGKYYEILNVNNKDEKNEFILLSCKAVT